MVRNNHTSVEPIKNEAGELVELKQVAPLSENQAQRSDMFNEPPVWMLDELAEWRTEHCKERCLPTSHLECTEMDICLDFKPRIGIITMPKDEARKQIFHHEAYVFEPNYNFVRWGENTPVAIPFDISAEDLDNLLPQLNGVWLTGGMVKLINEDGIQHPYYQLVKKVLNYSIY